MSDIREAELDLNLALYHESVLRMRHENAVTLVEEARSRLAAAKAAEVEP